MENPGNSRKLQVSSVKGHSIQNGFDPYRIRGIYSLYRTNENAIAIDEDSRWDMDTGTYTIRYTDGTINKT